MYADLGASVLAADLDPQSNLTAAFLPPEELEALWSPEEDSARSTIFGALAPQLHGEGDVRLDLPVAERGDRLALLPGDLRLAGAEDEFTSAWRDALGGNPRAYRVLSGVWRVLQSAAERRSAGLILLDLGPNLGSITRTALLSSNGVVVPVAPDLFSVQGLRNLGPALRRWRSDWRKRRGENPVAGLALPSGEMDPIGYVVLQHSVRLDRPVEAYGRWMRRIPSAYATFVLGRTDADPDLEVANDPHCPALLKHYRSLAPLAQEARKPMFHLKPADGALGSHAVGARNARSDFEALVRKIDERLPEPAA